MVLNRTEDFMVGDNTALTTNAKNLKGAINEVNAQLVSIANAPSASLINNNGTAITNLHFNLKKVDNRKFLTLPLYSTTFNNPTEDQALFTQIDNAVATQITTNQMIFTPGSTDAQSFFTTPFNFEAASYYVKTTVQNDQPNTWYQLPRVGIAKDANNWILGNVDKNNNKASFVVCQNGTTTEYAATTITIANFPAPYDLIFAVNGFTVYLIYCQNGVYKTLATWTQTSVFNFGGVSNGNLPNYYAAVGARATAGNGNLTLSGFECGYTSGMSMGADFKPFTYEDGSIIQDGNSIYFTSSVHSTNEVNGTGGANIFKLNLSTYKIDFVGRLLQNVGSNAYGGASYKVFYDRNRRQWVVCASNFDFNQFQIAIGFTTSDVRSGIHILSMQLLTLAGNAWDNDIIYQNGQYLMTYNVSGGTLYLSQSTDLINWTTVSSKAVTGEGNVFTRVNGNWYILRAETVNGLSVFDLNLNKVGTLNTNKWSTLSGNTTPTWGFLCPLVKDDKTNYFLVVFSMTLWENRSYTYGNVWVFKANEVVNGVEFGNKKIQVFNM